jgi:hypothetical protein
MALPRRGKQHAIRYNGAHYPTGDSL